MSFYINHYLSQKDIADEAPVESTQDISCEEIVMFRFDDGVDVELTAEDLANMVRRAQERLS